MVTEAESKDADKKIFGLIGTTTRFNALAQLDGLLSYFVDLAGAFPDVVPNIDPRRWGQIAVYGGQALALQVDSHMQQRLHTLEIHPDFEYKHSPFPPEGKGWVINQYKVNHSLEIAVDDIQWFMRAKADALKDDLNMFELPPIVIEKMTIDEYLDELRQKFCKGYMPSSTYSLSFNSKPKYVQRASQIADLYEGNEVYSLEGFSAIRDTAEKRAELEDQLGKDFFEKDGKSNLICGIEIGNLKILTNLKDDRTFVTVKRGDGTYQDWVHWGDFLKLPINRAELNKILELI